MTPSESIFVHLHMTHDLSCTLGALAKAAGRIHPSPLQNTPLTRDLLITAVAFTIQLAIDHAGRDPAEMRALERDLFAALKEPR